MGEHLDLGELSFSILAGVARAAAASNTRRSLVRRIGEAVGKHLPFTSFELGWCEDTQATSAVVIVFDLGSGVTESQRDFRATGISRIIQANRPTLETSRSGDRVVVIPLLDPENLPGYARIVFAANPSVDVLSGPVLETLGSILSFAQSHCRVIERIAKLSSTAHHESQHLREELRKYSEADRIVARSESMRRVLESVDLVAGHDTAVLLRGESGTGKELLARRIHRLSKRARQQFVSVNCGALPETLIESELFGHEKGAFTGAVGRYRGRFERANNGTIFLDEVAELPLSAQVKLLRVLQEGEFERLGGEETLRVNVRILAATHRPLEAMMQEGTFRADLFYRVNVFPIAIPPLRERKEDIPVLARVLLAETAKRLGCPLPALPPKIVARLLDCPWNGNVRELANTLERALIVGRGRELEFRDLPRGFPARDLPTGEVETFDDGARRSIQLALKACEGRIYGKHGAAARLGIPPSTLQGKMRKLRMSRHA